MYQWTAMASATPASSANGIDTSTQRRERRPIASNTVAVASTCTESGIQPWVMGIAVPALAVRCRGRHARPWKPRPGTGAAVHIGVRSDCAGVSWRRRRRLVGLVTQGWAVVAGRVACDELLHPSEGHGHVGV